MTTLASELGSALFAAITSVVALMIGRKKGFFKMPQMVEKPKQPPTFVLVFMAFAIYFAMGTIVPNLFPKSLIGATQDMWIKRMTLAAFTLSFSIFAALVLFIQMIAKPIRRNILLRSGRFEPKKDLILAAAAWLISFPLVLFVSTSLDIILYFITGSFELPDQIAVLFLKMTFGMPGYFLLAMSSVVLLAPLIEETIFRGFLQSWLRRYLSPMTSIGVASLFFTAFHFSLDQGVSNLSILASLFVLSCFLGFLYEKRQSLFAPLLLHALFNTLSIANLYFLSAP